MNQLCTMPLPVTQRAVTLTTEWLLGGLPRPPAHGGPPGPVTRPCNRIRWKAAPMMAKRWDSVAGVESPPPTSLFTGTPSNRRHWTKAKLKSATLAQPLISIGSMSLNYSYGLPKIVCKYYTYLLRHRSTTPNCLTSPSRYYNHVT